MIFVYWSRTDIFLSNLHHQSQRLPHHLHLHLLRLVSCPTLSFHAKSPDPVSTHKATAQCLTYIGVRRQPLTRFCR